MDYEYSEYTVLGILGAIIIFLDVANDELKVKCIEIIMSATSDFKMRDFLNELEYFGFEPKLFKQMIIERIIR